MPRARANGIEIEYETFGDQKESPLILINGLGAQLVSWPEEFCGKLAEAGHFVVRFDNRDVGLTTKLDDAPVPNLPEAVEAFRQGKKPQASYLLSNMAADTVGLMESLNVEKAHICGISMGGMIAQTMAIEHPRRCASLVSMESTTGEPGLPLAKPNVREAMIKPISSEREAHIQQRLDIYRLFSGDSEKFDEGHQREVLALSYDRSLYPAGYARQYVAIMASGSRKKALASVNVPALVIHGDCDTLLLPEHGKDTAESIPGAQFMMIKDLGHGMAYPALWAEMAEAITAHAKTER
jgi:pimeloyl-ACP methyl ester carboxylesterase